MTTNLKAIALEFIEKLRNTDEYKDMLEKLDNHLRNHDSKFEDYRPRGIIFRFDEMAFVGGQLSKNMERMDSAVVLCEGACYDGNVEIRQVDYTQVHYHP